jgi:hypothetical protein
MDRRHSLLRATLAYEGIAPAEYDFGIDYLEASPARAALLNTLLRGVLAERGNLLDNTKAAQMHGVVKGRALLDKLTTDNGQHLWRPEGVLTFEEWEAIQGRMKSRDMTCTRLLKMLMGTKAEIQRRQSQRQAA